MTPTDTETPTETETATEAPTDTPTLTLGASDTPIVSPTETQTESTSTSTPVPTDTQIASPTGTPTSTVTPSLTPTQTITATNLYLHGTGTTANPATLFLDSTAPTTTTTKYKDSASVNFSGGNPWKEVGTWTAAASQTSGQLTSLNDLHVWLGLKNSDDQGTRFDLRAEVYRNGVLISSGQTLCIPDITRNDTQAKEAVVSFGGFNSINMNGTTDSLSVKILTRVGTNTSGALCGGHSSATGLRLYFDSTIRPAKLGTVTSAVSGLLNGQADRNGLFAVSFNMPALPKVKADYAYQANTAVTIDYAYDPLYRLTSADYSTGDFYHYTYDSVGNRLSEETQLATKNYVYDEANRLASVDGVNYTFDTNGNLLNDGTSNYTYDSANRLIAVNETSSYTYNGLGDRLQQTVNNQTTTYALDLNAGLTQVLDDGENTYLYGLGRISQTNTQTEYFMEDALGSVRQLVNNNAEITLTKSYAPYGEVLSSNGTGESPFAFTGEASDASGLTYLRARYYNAIGGRFLSRDTWAGGIKSPMSMNRWNYVDGNPVNLIDPTGHRCESMSKRVATAEENVNFSATDYMNTYTAAGIGVQCAGTDDRKKGDEANSGVGIAQISDKQAWTTYGEIVVGNRGAGLRCFVPIGAKDDGTCSICKTPDQMKDKYGEGYRTYFKLERWHDQMNPTWAAIYMRRKIQQAIDSCKNCSATDRFIVAALAQNGPGFTWESARDVSSVGPKLTWRTEKNGPINWEKYIDDRLNTQNPIKYIQNWWDTRHQLDLFGNVAWELSKKGWYVENGVQWADIWTLGRVSPPQ